MRLSHICPETGRNAVFFQLRFERQANGTIKRLDEVAQQIHFRCRGCNMTIAVEPKEKSR